MADIVISEFMEEASVAALGAEFDVVYDPALVDDPQRLRAQAAGARALIVRNRTQIRGPLLAAAERLQAVGRLGVGLDNIDVAACERRGIAVYPATGANDLSVAEYVITAALMLLRGAWSETGRVASGEWPRQAMIGREMAGKTIGLVGFGAIAREVADRAGHLGMKVAAHDPFLADGSPQWQRAERKDLDGLLAISDVISLHTPLNDATRHLIDNAAITRMKSSAVVINAARGGIVDDGALAQALREGRIAGAALDVFETEPLTAAAGGMFAGLSNLILTPHIAGVTIESNARVGRLIADKIAAHLNR